MMWFRKKDVDYTTYEADEAYYDDTMENEDSASWDKRSFAVSTKIVVALIIYVFFLVIGIFSTSFVSNPVTGVKEAQIITVQMHEEHVSYNLLKEQYLIIRDLLTQTQKIDSGFQESHGDQSFIYATKYENLLSVIDKNIPKAKGLAVDSKYNTLLNQVVNIYTNDLAIYLQKMTTALSQQDQTAFLEAMSWREQTITDFEKLRKNMKAFASAVKIEDQDLDLPVPLVPLDTDTANQKN